MLCALALAAVPLLGPAAVAQTDPVFPEGVWRAAQIFLNREDKSDARGVVEYVGFGSARLEGVADGETINVSGEIQFEAASKGETALSTSERIYQGVWRVEGWGSTLDMFGDLNVKARETPKGGGSAPFQKEFKLEGRGVLALIDGDCLHLYVGFETELIPLPGAIAGPALVGTLVAFPDAVIGENDAIFEELTELIGLLKNSVQKPALGRAGEVATIINRMRELGVLAIQLQNASVGAGSCGPAGEYYRGGAAFNVIADLMGDLAFIVGFANTTRPDSDFVQVRAEEMIDVYRFAAAAGSFLSPDSQDIQTMDIYPIELEKLLADGITFGDVEAINAIWAAAIQFGWQDLAEKADSARRTVQ